jgi:excisionase family DNA binding protein
MTEELPTDLLTAEEVAEKLRVSDDTVMRLLRGRKLAGYKISGAWRIERRDLLAYMQAQKNIQDIKDNK